MEGIIIAIIGFIFSAFFGEKKEKNRERFKGIVKNIKDVETKLKSIPNSKNEVKNKSKLYNVDKQIKHDELKSNIIEELNIEVKQDAIADNSTIEHRSNEEFNLFNNSNDLIKAVIMSEILSKPKGIK